MGWGLGVQMWFRFSLVCIVAFGTVASAAGAIPVLACAETRVLALSSPAIELCFCFRKGFCGVL